MKTLIYQYWYGKEPEPCALAGKKIMEEYANRIGAKYRYEHNPTFISKMVPAWPTHYSALRPVFDVAFQYYDRVLFADMDIFPVKDLTENIFDCEVEDIGICEEVGEPTYRAADPKFDDEKWCNDVKQQRGGVILRTEEGLPKIFNSGLVLYTKEGMKKARANFTNMREHYTYFSQRYNQTIYFRDQSYINANIISRAVNWTFLDPKWNTRLHYKPGTSGDNRPVIDNRNNDTCMVHMQLSGSGNWEEKKLLEAVNNPVDTWSWR